MEIRRSVGTLISIGLLVSACSPSAATPPPTVQPTQSAQPTQAATSAIQLSGMAASACKELQVGVKVAGMTAFQCKVAAPSLANNLLGDPAELNVYVLVPSDYAASDRRYPSVYVLAGFGDPAEGIFSQFSIGVKKPLEASQQAVFVLADGANSVVGSFYANSSVGGNWEDAIANDLVAFVDTGFRTIPAAASRGISGHSMGGSGSLTIGMHRPDVFGAVYAMSPGLFDKNGAAARLGRPEDFAHLLEIESKVAATAEADRKGEFLNQAAYYFDISYGVAFAPDPKAPLMTKLPYSMQGTKLVLDADMWKVWESGFGGLTEKIAKYGDGLRSMRGIGIDYGTGDEYSWIPDGCKAFVGLLHAAKIDVTEAVFDGGHQNQLDERIANFMIPFMAQHLARS